MAVYANEDGTIKNLTDITNTGFTKITMGIIGSKGIISKNVGFTIKHCLFIGIKESGGNSYPEIQSNTFAVDSGSIYVGGYDYANVSFSGTTISYSNNSSSNRNVVYIAFG